MINLRIFPLIGSIAFHLALLAFAILISRSSALLLAPRGSSQQISVLLQEMTSAKSVAASTRENIPRAKEKTPAPTIAPVATVPATAVASANVGSEKIFAKEGVENGDLNAGPLAEYMFGLRRLIESKKIYPSLSRKMGETGKVLVTLHVHRDGSIQDVRLKNRSTFARLDEAALQTVTSVRQYQPLPDSVSDEKISVDVPIEFSL